MQLRNRRIILTGGTSGIGREIALRLAPDNDLVLLARPSPRSDALLADLPGITILPADLGRAEDIMAAGRTLAAGPPIHGLIHCAAVQHTPLFSAPDFDVASIREEIGINLTAACELVALLLPALLAAPRAFIMTVNSGLGLVPKTESAVYCATKGGLNIFTLALRNQLRDTPLRVQQAFLPLVDTPMTTDRGSAKLAPDDVARQIIRAIERGTEDLDIGKVKLLRLLSRIAPPAAARIMRRM